MAERISNYERDPDDFYVEPEWTVEALKNRVWFTGLIHDPCAGSGTIPRVFGDKATGADLVDRGTGYPAVDFLKDDRVYENIVTNPPYSIAQKVIEHALDHSRRRVAALVQLKFLASQARYKIFDRPDAEKIIIFSRRPSMPPGKLLKEHGEKIRGGGSIDFCWVVWNSQYSGYKPSVEWVL